MYTSYALGQLEQSKAGQHEKMPFEQLLGQSFYVAGVAAVCLGWVNRGSFAFHLDGGSGMNKNPVSYNMVYRSFVYNNTHFVVGCNGNLNVSLKVGHDAVCMLVSKRNVPGKSFACDA